MLGDGPVPGAHPSCVQQHVCVHMHEPQTPSCPPTRPGPSLDYMGSASTLATLLLRPLSSHHPCSDYAATQRPA